MIVSLRATVSSLEERLSLVFSEEQAEEQSRGGTSVRFFPSLDVTHELDSSILGPGTVGSGDSYATMHPVSGRIGSASQPAPVLRLLVPVLRLLAPVLRLLVPIGAN